MWACIAISVPCKPAVKAQQICTLTKWQFCAHKQYARYEGVLGAAKVCLAPKKQSAYAYELDPISTGTKP
jgi:hypothetical protein